MGTKNKPLEPLNDWLNGLINRRRAQFEKDLDACNPQQRAEILAGLITSTGAVTPPPPEDGELHSFGHF